MAFSRGRSRGGFSRPRRRTNWLSDTGVEAALTTTTIHQDILAAGNVGFAGQPTLVRIRGNIMVTPGTTDASSGGNFGMRAIISVRDAGGTIGAIDSAGPPKTLDNENILWTGMCGWRQAFTTVAGSESNDYGVGIITPMHVFELDVKAKRLIKDNSVITLSTQAISGSGSISFWWAVRMLLME